MKFLFPVLSLIIIYLSRNILGSRVLGPEPVNDILSNQYQSVCRMHNVYKEMEALFNYYDEVSSKINKQLEDGKSKLEILIKPMCQQDSKIKLLSENVVKKVCHSPKEESKIVQDVVQKICSFISTVIQDWHEDISVEQGNPVWKNEKIPEPVNAVLSKQYGSVCHLKDDHNEKDMDALNHYYYLLPAKFNIEAEDGKGKLEGMIKPMCQDDSKLKSLSTNLVKKACHSQSEQSKIVQDLVQKICSTVSRIVQDWRKDISVDIVNPVEKL